LGHSVLETVDMATLTWVC